MMESKHVKALALVIVGVAIGLAGINFADADDSPGAGVLALLLMVGAIGLAVRIVRREA